jgi:SRSO17 transposase
MDAKQIRSLRPRLSSFLKQFDDCFLRSDTRGHLSVYVEGQLSDLPRKSCEPIADAVGMAPRTLQQFLNLLDWDQELMKTKLQQLVAQDHGGPHSIGIIDETGCPKKGEKTPGVQRQWCGATGKKDNCVVTVHLGYSHDDFHCLLDSELFLPESWSEDRPRCRAAGIPDAMVHRPKTEIAVELYDRATANGVVFQWLTFDEGYGRSIGFLQELRARQQKFLAEIPVTFSGWIRRPRVSPPKNKPGKGRPQKHPQVSKQRPPVTVRDHLLYSPELRDQPWEAWNVKEGEKGPLVWEVKHLWFHPNGEENVPLEPGHLLVARRATQPEEIKFFFAHAPQETSLGVLLHVAFSRWRVERCFEDQKTELGFDHFEGRSYVGMMRHQIITALSHLFLSRVHQEWRGGKKRKRVDGLPSANRCSGSHSILVAHRTNRHETPHENRRHHQ